MCQGNEGTERRRTTKRRKTIIDCDKRRFQITPIASQPARPIPPLSSPAVYILESCPNSPARRVPTLLVLGMSFNLTKSSTYRSIRTWWRCCWWWAEDEEGRGTYMAFSRCIKSCLRKQQHHLNGCSRSVSLTNDKFAATPLSFDDRPAGWLTVHAYDSELFEKLMAILWNSQFIFLIFIMAPLHHLLVLRHFGKLFLLVSLSPSSGAK